MEINFDFKPTPQPKCKHCGKGRDYHRAETLHCPLGTKHRVVGYTAYSAIDVFEPKPAKLTHSQEKKNGHN